MIYKKLVSLNPQAPINLTKFNYSRGRGFVTDEAVD